MRDIPPIAFLLLLLAGCSAEPAKESPEPAKPAAAGPAPAGMPAPPEPPAPAKKAGPATLPRVNYYVISDT